MSHAQHEELESYNQFILTLPLNILMAIPRKVFAVIGITFPNIITLGPQVTGK